MKNLTNPNKPRFRRLS